MEVPNEARSEVCHEEQVLEGNRSNSLYIPFEIDVREPHLNRSLLGTHQPYSMVMATVWGSHQPISQSLVVEVPSN